MGTPFAAPVYSDGIDRARRDPAQARQAFGLLDTFRRDLPGYGTDDRYQQSQHFKGVVFLAISARMDTMAGASVAVLRRRRRDRKKVTFGPGGSVAKALATPHAESRDEEYAPFEDDGHALVRRMREPNDNEDIGDLLAYGTLQYDLTGTMPLWAVPNSAGRPVEFHALPTALTLPNPGRSPQYPNGSWRVQPFYPGGGMSYLPGFGPAGAVLPGEEVKRLKAPHPLLRWDGYSPLTAGSVQLDVLEAIDQSRWAAFDHGIQFDTVMIAPGMDEGAAQRLSSQMVEKAGGARNARKFVVFAPPAGMGPGDKTDIKTLNQSNREMDFHQSWEQAVAFGLALFGTPRGVVGLDTAGSYSQLYAELRQYHHRQSSYARKVSKFLTRVAARPWCSFPGEYVVQVDIPKPDDPDLLETQLKADQDILTVNQRHALRNRPPVEGGDVPASIYLDTLKAKLNPAPQPPQPGPGIPPEAGGAPKPLPGATPTGGAPPGEELPEAEGTRPPLAKAMSALTLSGGGALVPGGGAAVAGKRTKKRKCRPGLGRFLRRELKALGR